MITQGPRLTKGIFVNPCCRDHDHHHDHDHDDHGHDHDHEHGHEDHGLSEKEVLSTGTMILAGLYIFYLLETVMIFYQVRDFI